MSGIIPQRLFSLFLSHPVLKTTEYSDNSKANNVYFLANFRWKLAWWHIGKAYIPVWPKVYHDTIYRYIFAPLIAINFVCPSAGFPCYANSPLPIFDRGCLYLAQWLPWYVEDNKGFWSPNTTLVSKFKFKYTKNLYSGFKHKLLRGLFKYECK